MMHYVYLQVFVLFRVKQNVRLNLRVLTAEKSNGEEQSGASIRNCFIFFQV
jgi:hypothetical protein